MLVAFVCGVAACAQFRHPQAREERQPVVEGLVSARSSASAANNKEVSSDGLPKEQEVELARHDPGNVRALVGRMFEGRSGVVHQAADIGSVDDVDVVDSTPAIETSHMLHTDVFDASVLPVFVHESLSGCADAVVPGCVKVLSGTADPYFARHDEDKVSSWLPTGGTWWWLIALLLSMVGLREWWRRRDRPAAHEAESVMEVSAQIVELPMPEQEESEDMRDPAEAMEPSQQQAEVAPEIQDMSSVEPMPLNEALGIARARLAANELQQALDVLAPYRDLPDAPLEALLLSATLWRRMGHATGDGRWHGKAAEALVEVFAHEPGGKGLLHGIGRCRLEQAQCLSGAEQAHALDQAIEYLGLAAAAEDGADPRILMEWGNALILRAKRSRQAAGGDHAVAESAFRRALDTGAEVDSDAAWSLQWVLRQQAGFLEGEASHSCRTRARAVITHALENGRDTGRKAQWQASAIQLALEEIRAGKWTGAAKRMQLKEIQAAHRSLIVDGVAVPIVHAWVKLLCEEASELLGGARLAKYDEARSALVLAATPDDRRSEVELAWLAAHVARQRGQGEATTARLMLLSEAEKALLPYLDSPEAALLQLEAAHVALEQAGLLRQPAAGLAARRAVSLTETLFALPDIEAEALRCHLQALLMLEDGDRDEAPIKRLVEIAPEDAQTWVLAARHALACNDYPRASACSESALQLGASQYDMVSLWQQLGAAQGVAGTTPAVTMARKRLRAAGQPMA